jgi:OmpA-OmpF porin, OOP family
MAIAFFEARPHQHAWHALAALALCLAAASAAQAQANAATVFAVNGDVSIKRGERTLPVRQGTRLRQGDEISTTAGADALVRFDDGSRMAVRESSTLQLEKLLVRGFAEQREKVLALLQGGLRYISGRNTKRQKFALTTSTATIGIRGTDIEVLVSEDAIGNDPNGTYLKVNTGVASMQAVDGTQVEVDAGQVAFGGEPELIPRGPGGTRRPAARKIDTASGSAFKAGALDRLLR